MIGSIIKAFALMVGKPQVFLPAIFVAVLNYIALSLAQPFLVDLATDIAIYGATPDVSAAAFPFYLIATYPIEFLVLGLMSFFSAVVSIWALFVYSKFVGGVEERKTSIMGAFSYSVSKIGKVLGLAVFAAIVVFLFEIALWIVLALSVQPDVLGIIGFALGIALALLLIYLAAKLAFAAPAIAMEDLKVTEGLKKSWNFSKGSFLGALVFIVLVAIIGWAINQIGIRLAGTLGSENYADAAAIVVFTILSTAFVYLALPIYYSKARKYGEK